jgi:hypothetical protein
VNEIVHFPPVTLGPAAGWPNVADLVAHFDKRADFTSGWRRFQDFEGGAVLLYVPSEKDWKMRRAGVKSTRRNAQQRLSGPMETHKQSIAGTALHSRRIIQLA